jgi:acyl-CoA thioesterase I
VNSSFFQVFLHFRCVTFVAGLGILLAALPALAAAPKIMVFGDSLAAAYGLAPAQGWVALLDARLKHRTPPATLVNASISGETTRGGLSRIGADLAAHKPNLVLLELGGNDGLRGLPLRESRTNLASIIRIIGKANADVILAGIQIPPNYGLDYSREFRDMYPELAKQFKLPPVPFLLDGIADNRDLFQPDGLHPAAAAQQRILDNIWPSVEHALRKQPH